MIPASKSMVSFYRFPASLYSHFRVEVTHKNVVVGFTSEVKGPSKCHRKYLPPRRSNEPRSVRLYISISFTMSVKLIESVSNTPPYSTHWTFPQRSQKVTCLPEKLRHLRIFGLSRGSTSGGLSRGLWYPLLSADFT